MIGQLIPVSLTPALPAATEPVLLSAAERLAEICACFEQNDVPPDYFGPTGFHWLVRGRLGGMPRPGLTHDMTSDLEGLQRLGVSVLISLTAEWQPEVELIRSFGLDSIHLPIADMQAPLIAEADMLCQAVDKLMASGRTVVFHCRAGKGRTGTLLASQMIWYEPDHATAIDYVQSRNRSWIESDEQLAFLKCFADHRRQATGTGSMYKSTE